MNSLPASMSLFHRYAWCPHRPEESIGFPGTGLTDICEASLRFWGSSLGPLEEAQLALLNSELSLQTHSSPKSFRNDPRAILDTTQNGVLSEGLVKELSHKQTKNVLNYIVSSKWAPIERATVLTHLEILYCVHACARVYVHLSVYPYTCRKMLANQDQRTTSGSWFSLCSQYVRGVQGGLVFLLSRKFTVNFILQSLHL